MLKIDSYRETECIPQIMGRRQLRVYRSSFIPPLFFICFLMFKWGEEGFSARAENIGADRH